MNKRIYFSVLFWMLIPLNMLAQKEMNWWYFGYNAGLNFNEMQTVNSSTGTPTSLPNAVVGPINSEEGGFVLSDYKGDLLMSSDGTTIYNKNNEVMTNGTGLMGGRSSTQSAIVIPAPNNPNKFYVVTVAQEKRATGIRYSIVNINVDDPSDTGSVEIATKNSILKSGVSYENILAVPHTNGSDYWLIHRTDNVYFVWSLTNEGFSETPLTYVTPTLRQSIEIHQGESIISLDNTKLVGFTYFGREIISANFDRTTGVISDAQVFNILDTAPRFYGGSFSPNGEYLYYTVYNEKLSTGQAFRIKYSSLRDGSEAPTSLGLPLMNIKMASDKKLYGVKKNSKDLYVFMNPDEGGSEVRLFRNYLLGNAILGLPSFSKSSSSAVLKAKPFSCAGYKAKLFVKISTSDTNIPTKLIWDFGDGSEPQIQSFTVGITDYEMNHVYANSGLYQVIVTPYNETNTFSASLLKADVIDCNIKSNRMIRQNLLNINELEINK